MSSILAYITPPLFQCKVTHEYRGMLFSALNFHTFVKITFLVPQLFLFHLFSYGKIIPSQSAFGYVGIAQSDGYRWSYLSGSKLREPFMGAHEVVISLEHICRT